MVPFVWVAESLGHRWPMLVTRHRTLKAVPAHSFVLMSYFLWGAVGSCCCCCCQSSLAEIGLKFPESESQKWILLIYSASFGCFVRVMRKLAHMHQALHLISLMSISGRLPYKAHSFLCGEGAEVSRQVVMFMSPIPSSLGCWLAWSDSGLVQDITAAESSRDE